MPNSRSAVAQRLLRRRGKKIVRQAARAATPNFESLEARQFLSVSTNGGWTEITPSGGGRIIYVSSSSGSDSNSGSSSSSPIRSIGKGISMLRSGSDDQLLLKRGDAWSETLGFWTKSGKSANEPLVIGAYGSGARPRLDTGSKSAFMIGSKNSVSNIAIVGIHLHSQGQSSTQPTDGIQVLGTTNNLLIEDVKIESYGNNIVLQKAIGSVGNVKIRRSVIVDAYSGGRGHSQGLYAEGVNGLLLEENVFDHNGWRSSGGATMFNHNAYVTATTSGLVARGNVFSNASSHGLQARPGGTVENNTFINNAVGLTYGLVNGSPVTPGGVTGRVSGNVFIGAKNIGANVQSIALELGNIRSASVVNNVMINGPKSEVNPAISIGYGAYVTNPGDEVGVNNLTLENNVVSGWGRALALEAGLGSGGARSLTNFTVKNNDFQNIYTYNVLQHNNSYNGSQEHYSGNSYHNVSTSRFPVTIGSKYEGLSLDQWRKLAEPNASGSKVSFPSARTVSGYAGSESAFVSGARNLSRSNWDTKYTGAALASYIRAGYLGGTSAGPIEEPEPSAPPTSSGGSTSTGSTSIGSLTLVNGTTNKDIGTLTDGMVIDIAKTPYLNVRANTSPSKVGSVRFTLDGATYSTDNDQIYAIKPVVNGDYYSWTPTVGTHTLKVTPYSASNAGGTAGASKTVTFTVVKGGSSTPSSVPSSPTSTPSTSGTPSLTVSDVSSSEGNSGTKSFNFTVRLSAASSKTVTVKWETKTGSAVTGKDYKGTNSTLTFSPGQTSKTISIAVIGDRTRESNEQFNLNLLSAVNASIKDGSGVGTITNDD